MCGMHFKLADLGTFPPKMTRWEWILDALFTIRWIEHGLKFPEIWNIIHWLIFDKEEIAIWHGRSWTVVFNAFPQNWWYWYWYDFDWFSQYFQDSMKMAISTDRDPSPRMNRRASPLGQDPGLLLFGIIHPDRRPIHHLPIKNHPKKILTGREMKKSL